MQSRRRHRLSLLAGVLVLLPTIFVLRSVIDGWSVRGGLHDKKGHSSSVNDDVAPPPVITGEPPYVVTTADDAIALSQYRHSDAHWLHSPIARLMTRGKAQVLVEGGNLSDYTGSLNTVPVWVVAFLSTSPIPYSFLSMNGGVVEVPPDWSLASLPPTPEPSIGIVYIIDATTGDQITKTPIWTIDLYAAVEAAVSENLTIARATAIDLDAIPTADLSAYPGFDP
ncbi:MAG: hypothetical protein IPJ58_02900 [Ardenticatenia bacterium]|mgnify:CR=1 FL=1|nr:hypothetical protein [Ardenticatenia bacterium]